MTNTGTLSRNRKIGVLMICSMSLFMVGLDVTAMNVALPAIGRDMQADVSWLQWTVSAYTVMMASFLMFAGSMADRLGRKRTLITGMSVFSAASLLCSFAPNVELLVAFRVLQGVGASMLNPVAMSIITNTFVEPRERAQAIGVWGAVFGVSMALGPVVGGGLVSTLGWDWIFLMNVPLGAAAIGLISCFVPESKAETPRRFDPVGQVLMVGLLASVTFGIIEGPSAGWESPLILGAFSVAVVSLAGLLAYEPQRDQPLIDLRFFRSIPFSASITLSVAAFATFGGFLFLNTLYLQEVRGLAPLEAGLAVVPLALMTVIMSPVSGRITGREGPRKPLLIASATTIISCGMLVGIGAGTPFAWLVVAYVIFGTGFGLVNAPITNAAVSGMPVSQAGVAAAVATTSRQFGQAVGVAIVGAIVTSHPGSSTGADLAMASHGAWWALAASGVGMLVLGLVATSSTARESARRTRRELDPDAAVA
ncbi:MAG: DHA2 family efflux MFS transporter permease subunit [Solirubrobacterales bacterium]|nr:DHA2 family efflux MFS transporter permease subunit [Solirubrobacterales bacterium]HRV59075.1 DHA2 family efflux MFS transporter permease subunit [Solirubrobacterales bacterium]